MNWLTSRSAPLVAVAALALASCDKGTDLNVDLPDTTAVSTEYKDLPLEASTVRIAPVQTAKTNQFLVGSLADNVAGKTTAAAYFNVVDASGVNAIISAGGGIPADSLPSTVTAPVLDSVVLVMGFDRVYGSATTPVKFDVFNLAAPLDERQVYNGGTPVALGAPIALGLTSRLDRTITVTTAAVAATSTSPAIPAGTTVTPDPTVRLLLQRTAVPPGPGQPGVPGVSSSFATGLYAKLNMAGFNQAQLDSYLKGLAVLPNVDHNSSIVSFSKSYKSRILVYYHHSKSPPAYSTIYSIYFGPAYSGISTTYSSARDPRYFTTIDNVLPPALSALAARSGSVPPALLGGTSYVQEGTGLATRVLMKGRVTLKRLIGSTDTVGVVINRAEIIAPVKPFTNALYGNPAQLYAVEVNAANQVLQRTINFLPTDRIVQADGTNQQNSGSPTAGVLNATGSQSYYAIPVTAYMQAYFYNNLGGTPDALVLAPNIRSSAGLTLNRAALDATNIRLRVYYSQKR
ncbi:DUF4270 family protein [Hymenobacter armeniacus]|uniref:DUF4270 family protein n=1 Tax=Hymenobacter armeniacus TaxID=2771358 RepID=A0ABR8JZW6_9BACT|nr:DUF4270 family protein [Hymenobacter armeniacus]MBD2723584.1 DUF4270 family protein [Hymenobacter armeniacus]